MNSGWKVHSGKLAYLEQNNIDTDQIIPARFMSQPRADGYEDFLFHDIRRLDNNDYIPDFPLNRRPDASILLAGKNFGTGSSREAAAYALIDAGIKVVVARSFGDIFASNAVNNGLLPAVVSRATHEQLIHNQATSADPVFTVDLELLEIRSDGLQLNFTLDTTWQTKLINGWDDSDITMAHKQAIQEFSTHRKQRYHWAWPASQKTRVTSLNKY